MYIYIHIYTEPHALSQAAAARAAAQAEDQLAALRADITELQTKREAGSSVSRGGAASGELYTVGGGGGGDGGIETVSVSSFKPSAETLAAAAAEREAKLEARVAQLASEKDSQQESELLIRNPSVVWCVCVQF